MRSFEFADEKALRRIALAARTTAQMRISLSASAPACSRCGMRVLLASIFRDRGFERRTHDCLWCQHKITINRPVTSKTG
jgi:hypothetical protein